MLNDCRGSLTLESSVAVPLLFLFFAMLFSLNLNLFTKVKAECIFFEKEKCEPSDAHRAADVVFETGGELYDLFFFE